MRTEMLRTLQAMASVMDEMLDPDKMLQRHNDQRKRIDFERRIFNLRTHLSTLIEQEHRLDMAAAHAAGIAR
jgi:hypothetical protein